MVNLFVGIIILLLLYSGLITYFHFVKNPLPFPDYGHRLFGVEDSSALSVMTKVIQETSGLKPRFTFKAGPTIQTVFWDNTTVLNIVDKGFLDKKNLSPNAISLVVEDPSKAASWAAEILSQNGYTVAIHEEIMSDLPANSFVLLNTNALMEAQIAFRKHVIKMPKPKIVGND